MKHIFCKTGFLLVGITLFNLVISSRSLAESPEIIYTYSEFISAGTVKIHSAVKTNGSDIYYWLYCYRYDISSFWLTSVQNAPAETGISNLETILTDLSQTNITEYWLYVTNGIDTVWSGKQSTDGSSAANAPFLYYFQVDSITASSYLSKVTLRTHGYPCNVQFILGMDPYTNNYVKSFTLSGQLDDTTICCSFSDLNPYVTYYASVKVSNGVYPALGGWTRKKPVQTLYDSNAVGLTTSMIVCSPNQGCYVRPNFGVNSYGHYCYDLGLGERGLPPTAPGFDVRFIDSRSAADACLTDGTYIDIRPFLSSAQADTYKIRIIADVNYYPISVFWQDISAKYDGSVIFKTIDTSFDMRQSTSYTITNPDVGMIRIIATGPKPERFNPSIMGIDPILGTAGGATLTGLINPNGSDGVSWFEWGTTNSYSASTDTSSLPISFLAINKSDSISGLSPLTTYHYRAVVKTPLGIYYGFDQIFRTRSWTGVEPVVNPDGQFRLDQNYPNPFNPSTTIKYAIAKRGDVAIKVYNTLGQVVKEFNEGLQEAGSHEILFDASSIPSGIYFYQIKTSYGFVATKKMLLIK